MKRLNTKTELIETIEGVLAIEKDARENYENDLALFTHAKIKVVIQGIKLDEDRHIKMLEEILWFLNA